MNADPFLVYSVLWKRQYIRSHWVTSLGLFQYESFFLILKYIEEMYRS